MRTPGISGTLAFTEGVFTGPFFGPFAEVSTNSTVGNILGSPQDLTGVPTGGSSHVTIILNGAQVGGVNYTLPTVAAIVAAQGAPFAQQDIVGWWYRLRIVNAGSGQIITVVLPAGGGWTFTGGLLTIANNTTRDFVVQIISPTTANLISTGVGTYS
jgi:hypothetical protein